jgi:lipid-binding SYLF domain-containing protein
MKRKVVLSAGVLVCLLLLPTALLSAQTKQIGRITDAKLAFEDVTAIPEKTIPEFLLQDAVGIAIIPDVVKLGFIIGGEHGKGVLLLKSQDGSWSNPIFITLSGGSIGWQVGAQSADIILVFKTKRSVDGVLSGKFTLGVDVAAAAGPLGRRASASTDMELKAEIYSYSRSRGFFAGLSLDGAVLQIDDQGNAAFYGLKYISPRDIQTRTDLKVPAEAAELRQTVKEYTQSLGR